MVREIYYDVRYFARKLGVDSEKALFDATNKFINRFSKVEKAVVEQGKSVENMSMTELDKVWDSIK